MTSLWWAVGGSLAVTVIVLAALRPVASRLDFIDKPGGRKIHDGHVPVVGGLAMWVGFFVGGALLPAELRPAPIVILLGFMFVLLGLLDDRFALSAVLRLAVQIAGALAMVLVGGLAVHYVGAPFGNGPVVFDGLIATFLCLALVSGAMNAMNMVDGIDGLAGSLAIVALLAVAGVALSAGDAEILAISVVVAAAIVGFLIFNLPVVINRKLRTFMGDAGSLFIGFIISWCLVALSQNPKTVVAPVTLLWFLAMPIYDLFSTALGRMVRGYSPFHADTTHFHHALLGRGLSVPVTLGVLTALAVALAALGWTLDRLWGLPDHLSLLAFICLGCLTHVLMRRGLK